jgi:hypothetical protein
VTIKVLASDPANPSEPGAKASGLASVAVRWGIRGTPVSAVKVHVLRHVFTSPGLSRITVSATDRAGNATSIVRLLRILPAK